MGSGPRRTLRTLFTLVFAASVITTIGLSLIRPVSVEAAVNQQINFQGRLLNAQGAAVPDGYYNIEFKIYQDGDGQSVGNTTGSPAGSLEWSESHLNANGQGVLVKNGFMSVQLGSVTAFGSSVNWNQPTLWLSMNIGSSNPSCTPFSACTPDGEMVPMKRLSANAYALNAGMLGGLTSAGFIQNTTSPQTADFNITGDGVLGGTLDVSGLLTASGGLTASGAAINLNANSNNSVNIATGTSTGAVAIGSGLNTFSVDSLALDISSTGVISGATGITSSGTIAGDVLNAVTGIQVNGVAIASANLSDSANLAKLDASQTFTGTTTTIKPGTNSTTAFQVQPSGSTTPVFNVDTTNGRVGVGTAAPGYTVDAVGDINTSTQYRIAGNVICTATGCTPAAGSANYIQNGTTPQTADFNITGSGTIGGNLVANGPVLLQPGTNSTSLFNIKNTSNNNVFTVDTTNGRVGINLGGNTVPTLAGSGLEISGALRLSGNVNDSFVTPLGSSIGTKINIPLFDPGNFSQIIALGLPSTASTSSRGLTVLDARAGDHQPSIAVISPNESEVGGFSWDGDSSVFRVKTTSSTIALHSNGVNILNAQNVSGTGRVGIGTAIPNYILDVVGDVNTSTGYRVGGSAGASTTCSGGTFLQNATVVGGIITAGSCTAASNGVTVVGAFSATSIANGASISGNTITFGAADAINPGMVSTGSQTFAGDKTFNNNVTVSGTYNGNTFTNSGLTFSASSTSSVQSASSQVLNLNGSNGLTIQTNGVTRATFATSNNLYLGNGQTSTTPNNFIVSGTGSSATGVAGGALSLQGGSATTGNANGGDLNLSGGAGFGTGAAGLVVMTTPTFSTTANDPNCFTGGALVATTCTIAAGSVNGSSAILVGFSQAGQSATLPDPSISTAGRVVYITAANGSNDFTLLVNGGGTGNSIAMRQNTTATMIWNGSDWTAAGASSSTTLQSAYDNTLQSAGGAELIVSKTGTTNGLTIRDSSTAPVNGTLLSVQTSSAAVLFSVNSNVTEYSSNGGAETAGSTTTTFPANSWSAAGSSTVSRYITAGNFIATGQASVSVATTAAANAGVSNRLSTSLTANTNYNVSFSARLSTGTFTDMNVYYSIDGTANSVACATNKTAATSIWTKVNCTFAAPASGITANNAIIIRQATAVARTFYVENLSVTIAADYNYATDGSVNDSTNFATNWSFVNATSGAGTVTRNTADGYDASDSATVAITTGAANAGVRNRLSINPLTDTSYRVSVYAKLATGSFTDFKIRYSPIGSTGSTGTYVDCVDYNTQTITTTGWTQVTCYINTTSTAVTSPYIHFVEASSAVRTFSVDTFSMTLSTNTAPNVQVGGGVSGGPTTLFTLDKGASAPIASNNDALLGSMYYDTTLGKLQCYEADGWGACGSSPDNVVTISPEYTNAVLHGTGVGTMTSDLCSDTLNINDGSAGQATICGTNETYNFYKWTSPQPTAQSYSIFVTYQLPGTFKSFASGQTSVMGRTDSTNSTVNYQLYRSDATGLTQCGLTVPVSTGVQTAWQTGVATGAADPSTCGFAPGNSLVVKINITASNNANAYVGNLGFTFSNK